MEGYTVWLVAGAVIILVLASYASILLMRLRALSKAQRAAVQAADDAVVEFQPASNEHALGARESIRVLAKCFLDGQVGGSELCLRVAVLIDQPAVDAGVRQQAEVFVEMAAELADIPTHEAWKSLGRTERENYRKHMAALEEKHATAMREAAEILAR